MSKKKKGSPLFGSLRNCPRGVCYLWRVIRYTFRQFNPQPAIGREENPHRRQLRLPLPGTPRCRSTRSSWGPRRRSARGKTWRDRGPAWAPSYPAVAPSPLVAAAAGAATTSIPLSRAAVRAQLVPPPLYQGERSPPVEEGGNVGVIAGRQEGRPAGKRERRKRTRAPEHEPGDEIKEEKREGCAHS